MSIWAQIADLKIEARKEALTKNKKHETGQTRPFLGFTKKSSTLYRVFWAEESKTGLRFEIDPSHGPNKVPTGPNL